LDAYLNVTWVNRSQQDLPAFLQQSAAAVKEINGWIARVRNNKTEMPLPAYTGDYTNLLYGKIHISEAGNRLEIHYDTKPDLSATLDYMDNGEWLMRYNNILYGIFKVKFELAGSKVKSITTPQNPFVEYDPYVFTKTE
jgi:hypothetical protein